MLFVPDHLESALSYQIFGPRLRLGRILDTRSHILEDKVPITITYSCFPWQYHHKLCWTHTYNEMMWYPSRQCDPNTTYHSNRSWTTPLTHVYWKLIHYILSNPAEQQSARIILLCMLKTEFIRYVWQFFSLTVLRQSQIPVMMKHQLNEQVWEKYDNCYINLCSKKCCKSNTNHLFVV